MFNFNDHGLALVSLFANLITGFVPEFYEAYTTVTEHPTVAVVFWVSFYVVGVLASFNIFGGCGITHHTSRITHHTSHITHHTPTRLTLPS